MDNGLFRRSIQTLPPGVRDGRNLVNKDRDSESEDLNDQHKSGSTQNHNQHRGTGNSQLPADTDTAVAGKRKSGPGGSANKSKRLASQPDGEDERIIELKLKGYSDDYVANRLREEGYSNYESKTIASRWIRLRRTHEQREEERLDDEMSDWHVGEDDYLQTSVAQAEEKHQMAVQKLEEKKWKLVSQFLAEKLQKRKYTGKACLERYEGLLNGTALPAIELDPDQAGRNQMRQDRMKAAKDARAKKAEEQQAAIMRQVARNQQKKQLLVAAHQKRFDEKQKRIAREKEVARIKRERHARMQYGIAVRAANLARARVELDWYYERRRAENEIYHKYAGRRFGNTRPSTGSKKKGKVVDSDEEDEAIDEFESDEEGEEIETSGQETEEENFESTSDGGDEDSGITVTPITKKQVVVARNPSRAARPAPTAFTMNNTPSPLKETAPKAARPELTLKESAPATASKLTSQKSTSKTAVEKPNTKPALNALPSSKPAPSKMRLQAKQDYISPRAKAKPKPIKVTPETLANPRSIMTFDELRPLFTQRRLPFPAFHEQHPAIVARLAAADEALPTEDLHNLLRSHNESVAGLKTDCIRRLQEAEASKSIAGQQGRKSTDLDFMRNYNAYKGEFEEILRLAEAKADKGEGEEEESLGDLENLPVD